MKNAKATIAFVFMVALYAGVSCVEYDLAMHFRILSSVASVLALVVLMGGLFRAPEGYEDQNGFHIGPLADAVAL
jgi:hypothetical protein